MEISLYAWQTECLGAWKRNHYRGIVNVVTGAGKTVLALAAVQMLQEDERWRKNASLRVHIIVTTTPLMRQWENALTRYLNIPAAAISCVGGGRRDRSDRPYMIYIVNSARVTLTRRLLADLESGHRSGTSIPRQRIQRLGRLLRRQPGKEQACLYYLYVRESSEDARFLEEASGETSLHPVFDLTYYSQERFFLHPRYEEACARLLSQIDILTAGQLQELTRCLREGVLRTDWQEDARFCDHKIQAAHSRHERNYWICMKRLHIPSS